LAGTPTAALKTYYRCLKTNMIVKNSAWQKPGFVLL